MILARAAVFAGIGAAAYTAVHASVTGDWWGVVLTGLAAIGAFIAGKHAVDADVLLFYTTITTVAALSITWAFYAGAPWALVYGGLVLAVLFFLRGLP